MCVCLNVSPSFCHQPLPISKPPTYYITCTHHYTTAKKKMSQAPWMTPLATKLIEEAGESGTIDYIKFIESEMISPRDDAL